MVRELNGDVYFGDKGERGSDGGREGWDMMSYNEAEVRRIAHSAFRAAMGRGKKLTSVDKANVLETSRIWRETVIEVAQEYPEVELDHMYVDNAAMQLVRNPGQFDVIVTGNLFGDILSDQASMCAGSIGMLPSASLDDAGKGLYEPIHGSAPDIERRIEAVHDVLDGIGLGGTPELLIVNQVDRLPEGVGEAIALRHKGIAISALENLGLRELLVRAEEILWGPESKAFDRRLIDGLAVEEGG